MKTNAWRFRLSWGSNSHKAPSRGGSVFCVTGSRMLAAVDVTEAANCDGNGASGPSDPLPRPEASSRGAHLSYGRCSNRVQTSLPRAPRFSSLYDFITELRSQCYRLWCLDYSFIPITGARQICWTAILSAHQDGSRRGVPSRTLLSAWHKRAGL